MLAVAKAHDETAIDKTVTELEENYSNENRYSSKSLYCAEATTFGKYGGKACRTAIHRAKA